jgi:hypothetical protein
VRFNFDPATGTWHDIPSGAHLRGVFMAGLSEGLGDTPYPRLANPRARFFFTEAGWKRYGRNVYAAARQRGHRIKLIRRKNPARSQVFYQDAFQVAVLPASRR